MRLTTADIHPTDVKSIEMLVASMKRNDPTVTTKKYIRWCVIEMTNQLLAGIAKEQADKRAAAEAGKDVPNENPTESSPAILSEVDSGEGVNG